MGEASIAAKLRLRCFFQHENARGASLLGCNCRLESGAAAADHHHRAILNPHSRISPYLK
jgi:hypothetical protein